MEFLEYDMGEEVKAFSTKRKGGVSSGAYANFNITHYCGDDLSCVAYNRKQLCHILNISDDRLILPRQTHGAEVLCIDNAFFALSKEEQENVLYGIDAVITSVPECCIGVSTADCVPILLYDPVKHVVAAVHAGWRGTVARVVEKALNAMSQHYGTQCSNIHAVIAPSISLTAFEVGDEVYETFNTANFSMECIACKYGEKWHIDLWEANRLQLIATGVQEQNILLSRICTYNNCNDFFSARRLGINSGRIFNGIMIELR